MTMNTLEPLDVRSRRLGEKDAGPIMLTVEELVHAASWPDASPRILLPPIQRSLVWDNQRIIQFWDSLFRGYPVGTLMAHRPAEKEELLAIGSHNLEEAKDDDLALFDGQQRLHALRLGVGMVDKPLRKLWIDLGRANEWLATGNGEHDLRLPLRISGPGQPFGYQATKPNEKYGADAQRSFFNKSSSGKSGSSLDRAKAWARNDEMQLIGADRAIPLSWLFEHDAERHLRDVGVEGRISEQLANLAWEVLASRLILIPVPSEITADPDHYRRFFERIGRGGVALSDKELAYSMIKQQVPHIRAQMERVRGVGRIADEVDLVLGCFRIARTLEDKDGEETWRRTNYPLAKDLKGFRPDGADGATMLFMHFLPRERENGLFKDLFEGLCDDLCHGENGGLPRLLLSHVSGELWHVLLLLRHVEQTASITTVGGARNLAIFALWWLLFVENEQKSAQIVFAAAHDKKPLDLPLLVGTIIERGLARPVLTTDECKTIVAAISKDTDIQARENRFGEHAHLRYWADHPAIRRRALMWLHRRELSEWEETKEFDPASVNEDDLPIEFDHLIPQSKWSFQWSDKRGADRGFQYGRDHCGNAIGNFRILRSAENESRGNKALDTEEINSLVLKEDCSEWIELSKRVNTQYWDLKDIRAFQFVTQRRTLQLYQRLITESGIGSLVGEARALMAMASPDLVVDPAVTEPNLAQSTTG